MGTVVAARSHSTRYLDPLLMLSLFAASHAYVNVKPLSSRVTPMQHSCEVQMSSDDTKLQAAGLAAALVLAGAQSAHAGPFTRSDIASLTYEQIKGTGLANTCPKVEQGGGGSISLSSGKTYKIDQFCLEPTSFQVLEEKLTKSGIVTEAVNTKVNINHRQQPQTRWQVPGAVLP